MEGPECRFEELKVKIKPKICEMAEMKSLDASISTFSGRNVGSKKRKRIKQKAAVKAFTHDEFMAAAIGDTAWLKQSLKGEKDASRFDRNVSHRAIATSLHSI